LEEISKQDEVSDDSFGNMRGQEQEESKVKKEVNGKPARHIVIRFYGNAGTESRSGA